MEQFIISSVQFTGVKLGEGAYGSVEEVKIPGAVCAAKKLHDELLRAKEETDFIERIEQECALLSRLHHPHIVQFLGICYRPGYHFPLLVMERMPIDLQRYIETTQNIPLSRKVSFLKDVAQGLSFLHSHAPPIIHGNLTATNVLLSSAMVAKIADLRVPRVVDIHPCKLAAVVTRAQTNLTYMPPEVMMEENFNYTTWIDIFSYGILSLFVLTQRLPNLKPESFTSLETFSVASAHASVSHSEVDRRIKCAKKLQQVLGKDHPLVQIVEECLQVAPPKRPSMTTILDTLSPMLVSRVSASLTVSKQQQLMRASTQSQGEDILNKHHSGRPMSMSGLPSVSGKHIPSGKSQLTKSSEYKHNTRSTTQAEPKGADFLGSSKRFSATNKPEYKIAVVGSGGVGKSAIIVQYVQNHFLEDYEPTIEDSYCKHCSIDGTLVILDILDTSGQEEYSTMRDQYMASSEGFILVYAVDDPKSFRDISYYQHQILKAQPHRSKIPMIVVGNKTDLARKEVSKEVGESLARKLKVKHFDVSAKQMINIGEIFTEIVRGIKANPLIPKKTKSRRHRCMIS